MAEQSITSLFGDIVSPEAVRAKQAAEDLALGKFMAQNPGSAGMLYTPGHVRNVMSSIGSITGAETRSPEEIKAAENQKIFNDLMSRAAQQFPSSDPASRSKQLNFVADELQKMGKTAEAMRARDAAQASQLQEAKIYSEQAKGFASEQAGISSRETAATTAATRTGEVDKLAAQIAKEKAGTALTQEQMVTEILTRNPKLSKLDAEVAANTALANQRNVETRIAQEEAPLKRSLIRAETDAKLAGVKLDEKRVALVASQIDSEKVKQEATRQGISLDQAREKLVDAELERYIAMTPLEILKANTEIAKNNQQAELDKARMADIGMTEFTRNLKQLDATEEEKQKLLDRYINAKASSGGVSGMGEAGVKLKLGIVEKGINLAEGATAAMDTAQTMIKLLPDMNTGYGSNVLGFLNYVGSQLGIPGTERVNFANQLSGVLTSKITLDQASSLKGALSDKDLQFLKDAVGNRSLNQAVLQEVFTRLYVQRYEDQQVAKRMEDLLQYDDAAIRNMNITGLEESVRKAARLDAKMRLQVPVAQ